MKEFDNGFNRPFPPAFTFNQEWIQSAICFGWNELLRYSHPLFGRASRVRLDALVPNFLSYASGQNKNKPGDPNIFAAMLRDDQLPLMVKQLRKDCSSRQVRQIGLFIGRVIRENQRQRVTKLDRKHYFHDYIFEKWKWEWGIVMKALCEEFSVELPPEYYEDNFPDRRY
ncbi:MAG: hypothetical protein PHF35_04605 [Candidatus Moranbacteria bacterium]|nr:hypothetical protein [Candidatus Moranbacteria bacterium]